jgi:hypothetical protein
VRARQNGKVHFGYIYGVFVVGLLGLWSLLNLMCDKGIDIYRTASARAAAAPRRRRAKPPPRPAAAAPRRRRRRARMPTPLPRVVVQVMGYCLLPIVALAALSIPLDLRGAVGVVFIPLAVGWCANACSLFFVISLEADDRRWRAAAPRPAPRARLVRALELRSYARGRLVAYPVALFYTCFALITIF